MAIEFDAEVQRLLFERVVGYEHLEALLCLRADTAQSYGAQDLAARLRISETGAAAALEELTEHGLLEKISGFPPHYRYAVPDPSMAAAVDRLAHLYAEQRLDVIRRMSANAIERLRSSAARTFADAFLLRGRKE